MFETRDVVWVRYGIASSPHKITLKRNTDKLHSGLVLVNILVVVSKPYTVVSKPLSGIIVFALNFSQVLGG